MHGDKEIVADSVCHNWQYTRKLRSPQFHLHSTDGVAVALHAILSFPGVASPTDTTSATLLNWAVMVITHESVCLLLAGCSYVELPPPGDSYTWPPSCDATAEGEYCQTTMCGPNTIPADGVTLPKVQCVGGTFNPASSVVGSCVLGK